MSEQLFYVSKGQTLRGPQTGTKKFNKNGRFVGTTNSGKVYASHDASGNPIPLPADYIDFIKDKKESNGKTCLENLIESGNIVLEAGASSPVRFAKAMPVEVLIDAKTGQKTETKVTK